VEPRPPLFTRLFVLCGLANLAQSIAYNLFLHFPGFLSQLGADNVQVGLIFGVASVAAIVARPPMGRIMDLRGRRAVILVGGVLNCIVCGLYLSVTGMGVWIYVLRVGHGLAEALLFTALFTYAADLVPAGRRTEGLALFGVSGMAPMALGGLLGDWILAAGDYADLFRAALGFALVSLLLSLPLVDPPRSHSGDDASRGFWAALAQRDLLPLWWVGGAFALALATVFVFLKRFVEETGIGSVGSFFSAYCAAALVLRVGFGWLPDRAGAKRVLFPALGALVGGFLALSRAASGRDVVLAGLLCGIGHGYIFPILFALVVGRAREGDRGSAMAIFTALFDLGVVVGGPLFGAISRARGYASMYLAAALLLAGGSAVFAFWDRRR
jgi:MFS family permease